MSRTGTTAPQAASAQRDAGRPVAVSRAPTFKETVAPANDAFERQADRIAEAVIHGRGRPIWSPTWSAASSSDGKIQRKCADCADKEEEQYRRAPNEFAAESAPLMAQDSPAPAQAAPAAPVASPAQPLAEPAKQLLIGDDAEAAPGQMRKSEFLAALRGDVCAAVDGALSGTGRDSQGCPWIDHWFGYYDARSSAEVERALQRYAPETHVARNAQDYIGVVTERVRRSAKMWVRTGQISGVPEDVPGAEAASGELLGAFGGMFFKARPGGARQDEPMSVRRQLGFGDALPGQLRKRMERAFGANFGGVRLHTDARAAKLSDQLNARAFTIGRDVAFGAGEFKPGSIGGDALIAHELAHVLQQRGSEAGPTRASSPLSASQLEEDADSSAVGVVASLWGGLKGDASKMAPTLKSGLRLSRCSREKPMAMSPVTIAVKQAAMALSQRGSAEYKVQWSVGGGKDGWVIQHVKFGGAVQNAAGPVARNNADLEYWEGWQVRNGDVFVGSTASAHQTDTFRTISEDANTKGRVEIVGKVAFIEGYGLSEPPWGHTVAPAGALPTMTVAPTGWAGGSAQDHTMKVDYDDIAKTPQTQVGTP